MWASPDVLKVALAKTHMGNPDFSHIPHGAHTT